MKIDSDGTDAGDGPRKILSFSVQELRFCVEIHAVDSVVPLVQLQHVPGAPPHVKGLINLRGKPVVVVGLAEFLGLKPTERYTLDTPILLCSDGTRHVGLIVDRVLDVETVDHSRLHQGELFEGAALPFSGFVGRSDGESLMFDVERLLGEDLLATSPVQGLGPVLEKAEG